MSQVPDVLGLPVDQARGACQRAGFRVAISRTGPPWAVQADPPGLDLVIRVSLLAPDEVELLVAGADPQRGPRRVPRHLAIICDGNGRWAEARGLPRHQGHRAGTENVSRVVQWCSELGIEHLSLYAFSTENWRRPRSEVDLLMNLIVEGAQAGVDRLAASGIRVRVLGHPEGLPDPVREAIDRVTRITSSGSGMTVNLMLNYGGRRDIVEACRAIAAEVSSGRLAEDAITEEAIGARLLTAGLPDPDLVIRTAGDQRISNFLIWQTAYSELYFTPVPWPSFARPDLLAAIDDFSRRQRRYGGLKAEGQ